MQKSGVLGSVLILSITILFLSISFASASWYSDIWDSITGNSITGNAISGNGDCSYRFNGAVHTGKNNTVGLDGVSDQRFLCLNNKFYECGWEASMPLLVGEAVQGQFVGSYQCDLNWNAWVSVVVQQPAPAAQPATCTSFSYSNWSSCVNNIQTRSLTFAYPSGCIGGQSILNQSCSNTALICTSFSYSNWSECNSFGIQTRTINVGSPASCTGGNPILVQGCSINQTSGCIDVDGGLNYYKYGTANNGQDNPTYFDQCQGDVLFESICNSSSGKTEYMKYSCPSGCVNGVCISNISANSSFVISSNATVTSEWNKYPSYGVSGQYPDPLFVIDGRSYFPYYDNLTIRKWCNALSPSFENVFAYPDTLRMNMTNAPGAAIKWNGEFWQVVNETNTYVRGIDCVSNLPTCSSILYSEWSNCLESTQTRTIIYTYPKNCIGNFVLSQSCYSPWQMVPTMPVSITNASWASYPEGKPSTSILTTTYFFPHLNNQTFYPYPDNKTATQWCKAVDSRFISGIISGTISLENNASSLLVFQNKGTVTSTYKGSFTKEGLLTQNMLSTYDYNNRLGYTDAFYFYTPENVVIWDGKSWVQNPPIVWPITYVSGITCVAPPQQETKKSIKCVFRSIFGLAC